MEKDDSLDLDEEEDSHGDDTDNDKRVKDKSKDVNGKPPYSYVAMIGKMLNINTNLTLLVCSHGNRREP